MATPEFTDFIKPLNISRPTLRLLAMIYLVTFHYTRYAYCDQVKHDLNLDKEDTPEQLHRVSMVISRIKARLESEFFITIIIKKSIKADPQWGQRYYEIDSWGILNKSTVLALIKLHRSFFEENYLRLIYSDYSDKSPKGE